MTPTIGWDQIILRLALTLLAGAVIGVNRGERGHAAGFRTTIIVCIASSLSMIEVNLLLTTVGKGSNSFIQMDPMRLPLGVLSGMGFIGAGAILRRGDSVSGVTTAATLWFVTVIGLCIGGGQLALGAIGTGAGLLVLWGLRYVEEQWLHDRRATLSLVLEGTAPVPDDIARELRAAGYIVTMRRVSYSRSGAYAEARAELRWSARALKERPDDVVARLKARSGVVKIDLES